MMTSLKGKRKIHSSY